MAGEPMRQQTREPVREPERLTRRSVRDEWAFHIPPDQIPVGFSYEFKRTHILNEPDTTHTMSLALDHWKPVPTARHPHMMPVGTKGDDPIVVKGMMLMERPEYLTHEARLEDQKNALEPLQTMRSKLTGTPLDAGPQQINKFNRTVERGIPIPD